LEVEIESLMKTRKHRKEELTKIFKKDIITVYVAGPIYAAEEAQAYRTVIKEGLQKVSPKFKILDPWEREQKQFGGKGLEFNNIVNDEEKKDLAENVIRADLQDIYDSDLVIAYLFKSGPWVGTSCEIFWMYRVLKKPVIVVYTRTDKGDVPLWIYGNCNLILGSASSLFNYLKKELED